jgi:hypothetical protein
MGKFPHFFGKDDGSGKEKGCLTVSKNKKFAFVGGHTATRR